MKLEHLQAVNAARRDRKAVILVTDLTDGGDRVGSSIRRPITIQASASSTGMSSRFSTTMFSARLTLATGAPSTSSSTG